ncbi:hypothetical protein AX27061_0782 [Achromobacter xylosoxidans NBRC 15126 = ATCC 27061]|nr:hypothetical protein AX27061_0782 [Achromobacter xylosoxidans NBRC 15126 = ATCC 27061]CCH05350.1 hypothetical protein NH44784_013761 [Achromobacter xylosoxidans NH44784-1996]
MIVRTTVDRPQPDKDHQRAAVVVLSINCFLHFHPPGAGPCGPSGWRQERAPSGSLQQAGWQITEGSC